MGVSKKSSAHRSRIFRRFWSGVVCFIISLILLSTAMAVFPEKLLVSTLEERKATIGLVAEECSSDRECRWCGLECVRDRPGLYCPMILPPPNCECKCVNGECVKVCIPNGGPEMSVHPKEIETDIHQGSEAEFTISVMETSGEAPLKDVTISLGCTIIMEELEGKVEGRLPGGRCIPKDWIDFDKNGFDVPPGGRITVKMRIEVDNDAKPGKYFGYVIISARSDEKFLKTELITELTELVLVEINVLKDVIPPEIEIRSPRNGEVVSVPYVVIEGVVRDNIGIKSLKINGDPVEILQPMTKIFEEGVEIQFSQEMQLREGRNTFLIEAVDLAGNSESETIYVKYEKREESKKRESFEKRREEIRRNREVEENRNEESKTEIEELEISIQPKYVEANPGESIEYTVVIDWYPPEWRGEMNISASIVAGGFEKKYSLKSLIPVSDPPIIQNVTISIPENLPPVTYKLKLEIEAESVRASEETELKITRSEIPGFGFLTALVAVALLMLRRRNQTERK